MKIVEEIRNNIDDWKQNGQDYGELRISELPRFTLTRHNPALKSILIIKTNYEFVNITGTDFYLDAYVLTFVHFDIDGNKPTIEELYEVYSAAREKDHSLLYNELVKKELYAVLKWPEITLEMATEVLTNILVAAYPDN